MNPFLKAYRWLRQEDRIDGLCGDQRRVSERLDQCQERCRGQEARLRDLEKLEDIIMAMDVFEQRKLTADRTSFSMHFEISETALYALSDIEQGRLLIDLFRDQATRGCMDVIRQRRERQAGESMREPATAGSTEGE